MPDTRQMAARAASFTPQALALLRIVTAFLFLQHATAKLFGVPHVAALEGVQLMSLFGIAGVIELVGGVLVLIGLWTRAAAFVLSGEMAVAYFMVHAAQGHVVTPMLNGGELAVMFCFVFLLFAEAGGGAWANDRQR
jgi:putative oxidoreductase